MPKKNRIKKSVTDRPAKEYRDKLIAERSGVQKSEQILLLLITAVVILIILVGPFFRGLFFPRELIFSNILIFSLLVLWGIYRILKNDGRILHSPMDLCLLILFIAYMISFFFAINKRDALTEVLRYASYLIVFIIAIDIGRYLYLPWRKEDPDRKNLREENADEPGTGVHIILYTAIISALAISVASIAIAIGHFDLPAAYAGNRIASPIGYSNTAAAYLMAVYFLIISLMILVKKWLKVFLIFSGVIVFITVILTFSRGAWLLIPPLAVLLVIVSPQTHRFRIALYLLASLIPALLFAFITDTIIRSSNPILAWLAIAMAAIISFVLVQLADRYLLLKRKLQILILSASAAAVIISLVVYLAIIVLSPVVIESSDDGSKESNMLKQVIEPVLPDEHYTLSFEIKVEMPDEYKQGSENHWTVKVYGGLQDFSFVELASLEGDTSDNWALKEITFVTPAEIKRLEVLIYNNDPKESISLRSVVVSSSKSEQNIYFIAYRLLPESFYNRVYSIGRDVNMERRFELFGDAIKVIKDYPIFGIGGGGWAAIYKSYIDSDYNSRQVHNQFLQVWVESGVIGFLAFTSIWLIFAIVFYLNYKRKQLSLATQQLWTSAFIPVIAIGLHSIIDWHFAMTSVGFLLFSLLGAGMSMDQIKWFKWRNQDKDGSKINVIILGSFAILIGVIMAFYSGTLFSGLHASWHSQELVEQRNFKAAISEMERAIALDPLRAENYYNMNVILEDQVIRTGNPAAIQNIVALAQKSFELEPFNERYVLRYGKLLIQYIDVEQGLELLDRAMVLNPFSVEIYVFSALTKLNIAEYYMQNGLYVEAERHLIKILDIDQEMKNRNLSHPDMIFALGRVMHLRGDINAALFYYNQVQENDNYFEQTIRFLEEINGLNED